MDPADPQTSMLTPVVAGRCILLGSNSGLFLLRKLLLRALAKRLYSVDCTRHLPYLRIYLTTTDETDNDTGADNECQNESVFAVFKFIASAHR